MTEGMVRDGVERHPRHDMKRGGILNSDPDRRKFGNIYLDQEQEPMDELRHSYINFIGERI
jgi:hypothetical protein